MTSPGLKEGTTVGDRYHVDRLLGQGELGRAYLCRDLMDESLVVLRTLTEWDSAEGVGSLRQELSFLSRFKHPHLAHLLDFGVIDHAATPYVVRQFVEGADAFHGSAGWSIDRVLSCLAKLCRVLQFLHSRNILHHHLKPSNVILVDVDGREAEPKILDFGLNRRAKMGRRSPATIAYTAPEILLGHARNPRSDLYSLGILAYQLLARRLPFDDEDEGYLIQKHLQGKVDTRPIERLRGGAGLAQVLLGLLEKDPDKRPSSAEDVVRLLSAASGRDYSGTVSGSMEAYFSPGRFVGREKEMACLQERAIRVRQDGRGWTIFLTGEGGSGKSRCLEELRTWALLEGWRVVEAACLPCEDRSYGPYRRILARAAQLRPAQGDATREHAIFRFEDAARAAESPRFELSSGSAAGPFRDQLTREVVRLLADRPTLFLLHDFHWADEATVTVLDYLTSDILAHPIFLCVSLRPAEAEQGPLRRLMELSARQLRAETLALEALPLQAIEDLIAGITGETSLAGEIGTWVHKSSGGNPFFVEEILKHLVDRELLWRESGHWRLASEGFEDLEVPASVAVVLRRRLAQLSPGAFAVTEWLALARRALPKDQLRALSSLDSDELETRLRELISRQIIGEVSGRGCFEFRHALISEVITEDLPAGKRRRMHQRIGEILEEHHGTQENLQELAMHFTEGRCGEKAISYALRAARACKAEFANESALRFYEYLLNHKKLLSMEQQCDVSIEAADSCCALGNPKRAIRILGAQLHDLGKGKRALAIRLYTQLSRSFQYLGDMEKSEQSAKHGMTLLGRPILDLNKSEAEIPLLSQLAFCRLAHSQPRKGLTMIRSASRFPSKPQQTIIAGHLHILISALCSVACDFVEGAKAAKTAIEILEPLGADHLLPMAYSHLGNSLIGMGKLGKALHEFQRAVSTGKRTRSPFLLAQALCNLTECFCRSGQFAAATENSTKALKAASETENRHILSAGLLCVLGTQIATTEWSLACNTKRLLASQDLASLPVYARAQALFFSASLHTELGSFEDALSDLDSLQRLVSSETPIYEASLGEILRAKIYCQQGHIEQAKDLLLELEITVTQKRWAYQMTLAKLQLAQAFLMAEDWQEAFARARGSLRLARAMPALHLQAQAHYLLANISLLRAEKSASAEGGPRLIQPLNNQDSLKTAYAEFEKALALSDNPFMIETARRTHYAMMRICRLGYEPDGALRHAQKTLELLSVIEGRVPIDKLDAFKKMEERERSKNECECHIRKSLADGGKITPSIGDLEEAQLRILFRMSSTINAIRDLDDLMEEVLGLLATAMCMERALIALKDRETGQIRMARKRNLGFASLETMDVMSRKVIQEVIRSGKPFVTANARSDPRLTCQIRDESAVGSFFCAPLVACGRTLGLLYADHRFAMERLNESTINLFAAFCNITVVAIDNALAHRHLMQEKKELEQYLRQARGEYPELIGKSPAVQELRERIGLAAASPLDVLTWGESGTGKELVARALHRTGRRAGGKFVPLDCGSLSDTLVEGELFGYRKGAFTGAVENRPGLFEAAEGGVIFLDEISNLSLRLQRKLLRVLQEREVRRIGETAARKFNVQVIVATNRDLRQEMREGRFREDLYFRLNAMEIRVAPLRERTEDVPLLLEWFLDKVGKNEGGRVKTFSREAHALLVHYSYPGNVRELKNIVEGSYYSTPGDIIGVGHLPTEVRDGEAGAAPWEPAPAAWQVYKRIRDGLGIFDDLVKTPFLKRQIGSSQVRQMIHLALAETGGRYRDAFRLLGIPAREYATMIQFLKRNDCYLDFRPYRKPPR